MATTHTLVIRGGISFGGELQLDQSGDPASDVKMSATTYTATEQDCISNLMTALRQFDHLCGGITSLAVAEKE